MVVRLVTISYGRWSREVGQEYRAESPLAHLRRVIRQGATRATPVVCCTAMHNAGGSGSTPVADRLSTLSDWGYFNVNDYSVQQFLRKAIRTVRQCWILSHLQWAIPCSYFRKWSLKGFFLGCWTMWSQEIMSQFELMNMSDFISISKKNCQCIFMVCDSSLNQSSRHAVSRCSITLSETYTVWITLYISKMIKIEQEAWESVLDILEN